jgi:hypothetical protein
LTSYDEFDFEAIILRASKDLNLFKPLVDLALALQLRYKSRIFTADALFPVFDALACILLAFKLLYSLNDSS